LNTSAAIIQLLDDLPSDSDVSSDSEDSDDVEDIDHIAQRRDRGEDAQPLPGDGMFRQGEILYGEELQEFPDGEGFEISDGEQNEEDEDELLPDLEPTAERGTYSIQFFNLFCSFFLNSIYFSSIPFILPSSFRCSFCYPFIYLTLQFYSSIIPSIFFFPSFLLISPIFLSIFPSFHLSIYPPSFYLR
jgi:hypothetical protein